MNPERALSPHRAKIRTLHAKGFTDSEIADRISLSLSRVTRLRAEEGLNRNKKARRSTLDIPTARKLHANGLSDRGIAEKMGVSRETVQKWRRSERLPSHFR